MFTVIRAGGRSAHYFALWAVPVLDLKCERRPVGVHRSHKNSDVAFTRALPTADTAKRNLKPKQPPKIAL
jgi:hypothetical protein